jgi:hypothetical protein
MIRVGAGVRPVQTAAIPDGTLDYITDVETWWSIHAYNPSSPNCLAAITPPANTVNVDATYAGDLQAAIDALPSSGGALILGNTSYGRVVVTGKSHVHFLGVRGGTTTIRGVSIRNSTTYTDWYWDWVHAIWIGNGAAIAEANNRQRDFYFRDILFDGQGDSLTSTTPSNGAFGATGVRDILFDRCIFQNYTYDGTVATPAHINASGMVDGVWARWCSFIGNIKHAMYLDGVHGGGMVACTCSTTIAERRIIVFNNNDFTYPYSGNATMQPNEIREPRYIVVAGNTFAMASQPPSIIQYHGADGLFTKNVLTGTNTLGTFLEINVHCYNPTAAALISGGKYESYRNVMAENTLVNVTNGLSISDSLASDPSGVSTCTAPNYGVVGKYTTNNNKATSVTAWVAETGTIATPNVNSGNTP